MDMLCRSHTSGDIYKTLPEMLVILAEGSLLQPDPRCHSGAGVQRKETACGDCKSMTTLEERLKSVRSIASCVGNVST
jgi:hypothetical protein